MEAIKIESHEQWLEERKRGLGGSDAAAACGLSRWKSPVRLYLEKIGELESTVSGDAVYWGNVLEDVVAREFQNRTGKKVRRCNRILVHPEHEFMLANIDRDVVGEDSILECKTTSAFNKEEWEGENVPREYLMQGLHYLAVTGAQRCYFAVLIGGNNFQIRTIERDEDAIEHLIKLEKDFWENNVVAREAPEMDGSDDSSELLKKLYPAAKSDDFVRLPMEADEDLEQLESLKRQAKEIETMISEIENRTKDLIGDSAGGVTDSFQVTWKNVSSKRFDSKAFEAENKELYIKYLKESVYRRFAVKKIA